MKKFVAWLVNIVFVKLDKNGDGVVSKQEVHDSIDPLVEIIANQLNKRK